MKWLNRLRCELQDHIRVTEKVIDWPERAYNQPTRYKTVTRCTRCGWTSRRMDGNG